MLNIKTIYFKNLVDDLIKHRKIVGFCIVICAAFFAVLGYKNALEAQELSAEQEAEIQAYNERLAAYDVNIADAENALEVATKQMEEYQEYVDNSIYMKLDPQNIQVASVQYGVQTSGDLGAVLNSIYAYINDGGLKEAVEEDYGVENSQYWREIINAYNSGNVLNITVFHYDAEEAKKILSIVKEKLERKLSDIVAVQGEFTLIEQGTSYYALADAGVMNNQNGHLNNLKNYQTSHIDYENRLQSEKSGKISYIDSNKPKEEGERSQVIFKVLAFMTVGMLFGIVIPVAYFLLHYILSNRLRNKEDLRDSGLPVLESYNVISGYQPPLERSVLDLKLLAEAKQIKEIFISVLQEDDISKRTAKAWEDMVIKYGLKVQTGYHLFDSVEELKTMTACEGCLILAEAGKTTYSQLEQQMKLCERLKTEILGCIVIE